MIPDKMVFKLSRPAICIIALIFLCGTITLASWTADLIWWIWQHT